MKTYFLGHEGADGWGTVLLGTFLSVEDVHAVARARLEERGVEAKDPFPTDEDFDRDGIQRIWLYRGGEKIGDETGKGYEGLYFERSFLEVSVKFRDDDDYGVVKCPAKGGEEVPYEDCRKCNNCKFISSGHGMEGKGEITKDHMTGEFRQTSFPNIGCGWEPKEGEPIPAYLLVNKEEEG